MDFKNLEKKTTNQKSRYFCQIFVVSKGMDLKTYWKSLG